METTCKTWRCLGCRDRLLSRFKMLVEHGSLVLGPCVFTTFTLKMGPGLRRDARYVARVWREFWRRWNRGRERFEWLRVVELTEKGQPHLHVMMGPVNGKLRCYGKEDIVAQVFKAAGKAGCGCLSHRLSDVWASVTGDSWVVHVVPVVGAGGAASYMAKYLPKGFDERDELERLGFKRRWSSTRGWPGGGRLRLRVTVEEGWNAVTFGPKGFKGYAPVPSESTLGLDDRVGTDLAVALVARNASRRVVNKLRRMLDAKDDS